MKKNPINYILLFLLPLCCLACNQWEGETVESAYREPTIPDPVYQFKRNGASSVDYLECSLLRDPHSLLLLVLHDDYEPFPDSVVIVRLTCP